jgi:acyl-CoA thioesterase
VLAPDASPQAEFDRAIAIEALGGGRYDAIVDPGWSAPMGPNGGYLAALATRAFEAELDPAGERRLRSLTCHFLRRPAEAPIELRVEPTRSGRRLAFGRLTGHQDGREVLSALAAFAVPGLPDVAVWTPPLPDVPGPPGAGDGRDWLDWVEGMPRLMQRVRLAPRIGTGIFSGRRLDPGEAPVAGGWIELAEPRGIDAALVALYTDVWWPPSLEPLSDPAGAPTIDLTIHFRADLPRDGIADQPVLGRWVSNAATGGLTEEDGVLWTEDGTVLAQSRQLALLARLP